MDRTLFSRLGLTLKLELEACDHKIDELLAREYPTNVAAAFAGSVRSALKLQGQRVAAIAASFQDDEIAAVQQLQSEHRKLYALLPYLDYLERAQSSRVPWSFVPFFERLAAALVPGVQLLTTSVSEFNYGLDWYAKPAYGANILFLPSLQRVNAFLHVLVGHELFHPLVQEFVKTEKGKLYTELRPECQKLMEKTSSTLFPDARLDQVVEMCARIWERATTELLCDLGCCILFGPAAVLAISTYAICSGLDSPPTANQWYPPMRTRLRNVLRFGLGGALAKSNMERLYNALRVDISDQKMTSAARELEKYLSVLVSMANETSDQLRLNADPHLRVAYAFVDSRMPGGSDFVAAEIEKRSLKAWHTAVDEIPALLRAFDRRVPASEVRGHGDWIGPPSNPFAATVAAWLCELRPENAHEELEDYLARCRLLFKSLEDSHLKLDFEARLATLEDE